MAITPVCKELTCLRIKEDVCTCFVFMALLTDFLHGIFIVGGGSGFPAV